MEATTMRQKLHQYIDLGDEKLLKIMYVVAKEYNDEYDDSNEHSFSKEDIQEFESHRQKRLHGASKTYSWEDAKNIITGKNKPDGI